MLLGPYKKIYEGLYVFSPSVQIDSAWDPVKEFVKSLKYSGFYQEWDEKALAEILDTQRGKIKEMKDAKTTKPLSQILEIVDDMADRPDVTHNSGNVLTSLRMKSSFWSLHVDIDSKARSRVPCRPS